MIEEMEIQWRRVLSSLDVYSPTYKARLWNYDLSIRTHEGRWIWRVEPDDPMALSCCGVMAKSLEEAMTQAEGTAIQMHSASARVSA